MTVKAAGSLQASQGSLGGATREEKSKNTKYFESSLEIERRIACEGRMLIG